MKRHLGKKAMAVVTAALLMMSAVPANVMAEETTEATAQTEVTQETVQATAETTSATQETEETTAETAVTQQEQELSTVSTTAESDFELDSQGYIVKYNGTETTNVTLPGTVNGVQVKGILMTFYTAKTLTLASDVTYRVNTSSGYYVASGWESLESIRVESGNTSFVAIDGVLYDYNKTELIGYPMEKKDKSYTVPAGVTDISNAFHGNKYIENVTLPEGLTDMGMAFMNCTALKEVNIPSTVTDMYNAFTGCESLESDIIIPAGVTELYETFWNCKSIKNVKLPDERLDLGAFIGGFTGCTSLESINIPIGVTVIPSGIFSGLPSLNTISIPESVVKIQDFAFRNSGLTSITIPKNVTEIENGIFDGCTDLKEIIFEGNAPQITVNTLVYEFSNVPNATVYYYEGATGFTTPKWMNLPCYPLEGESPDNQSSNDQPSDDIPITTPSGDILDIGELSQEEQDKVENKVLAVLNVENLRANEAMHFYDITLTNKETGKVYTKDNFPKEGVTVTIPYPTGMNKNSHLFRLFHFANGADGEGTEVEITLTDEGIQFHVYSLSPFALVSTEAEANGGTVGGTTGGTTNGTDGTAAADTDMVTSPKTGDNSMPVWWITSMLIASVGCAVIIKKKATKA